MTPRICLGLKLSHSKVKAVYCCVGASESRLSYHSRVFLQLPEPVSSVKIWDCAGSTLGRLDTGSWQRFVLQGLLV
jgi:hypothetical protein